MKLLILLPDEDWLKLLPLTSEEVSRSALIIKSKALSPDNLRIMGYPFAQIHLVDDYLDYKNMENAVDEIYQSVKFERIVAPDEVDILRCAKLREKFNLPGQNINSALIFYDKILMKRMISQYGLPVPAYQEISSINEIQGFIKQYNYPVIIKPSQGTGCEGITVLETEEQLKQFKTNAEYFNDRVMMIESFVDGTMYHINGLMARGEVVCAWPAIYLHPAINIINGSYASSHLLSHLNPLTPKLVRYAERVLEVMPTEGHIAFHLEVFLTHEDADPIFCEIASRVGGKGVNDGWKESFGIDLKKEFLAMQCGIPCGQLRMPVAPANLSGEVWFPRTSGVVKQIETSCPFPWVLSYQTYARPGEVLSSAESITDLIAGSPLIIGSSEHEIKERIVKFAEWFHQTTEILPLI